MSHRGFNDWILDARVLNRRWHILHSVISQTKILPNPQESRMADRSAIIIEKTIAERSATTARSFAIVLSIVRQSGMLLFRRVRSIVIRIQFQEAV